MILPLVIFHPMQLLVCAVPAWRHASPTTGFTLAELRQPLAKEDR
jgi:hypothetical protein